MGLLDRFGLRRPPLGRPTFLSPDCVFNGVKCLQNGIKVSVVGLSRDTVVRAALELLDEVGLADLTLRGVAERLGVQAPALYWHVRNRQDLID